MEEKRQEIKKYKKSLWRQILVLSSVMVVIFCILATVLTYALISGMMRKEYSKKLTLIIELLEKRIDNDDLADCIDAGAPSEKYAALQQYVNEAVDDFGTTYIYIVIPKKDRMVNVLASTNAEEREAGEEDYEILYELTGYYSEETLAEFIRYYEDTSGINVFEETSEWGSFYTGCKTLVASDGRKAGLLCVDIPMESVVSAIVSGVLYAVLVIISVFVVFDIILLIFIRRRITKPLALLVSSSDRFSKGELDENGRLMITYVSPPIENEDEVGILATAIKNMADNLKKTIDENVAAKKVQELSRTVVTLLDNMPAMTFYKEIETGKYLACNQAFADKSGKASPRDVVGLTDFDLYDEETARQFVEYDRRAIELDAPLVYYEEAKDTSGNPVKYQTTKFKFTDTQGKERLLGMCIDLTEIDRYRRLSEENMEAYVVAKKESLTYANIARSLSLDYAYIFYVNIETDEYIQYSSSTTGENLSVEVRGTDFFNESRKNSLVLLDRADQDVFVSAFTKENILAKIDSVGSFTITYRLVSGPSLGYHNMKGTYLKGDNKHIIIGVSNIDEQIKEQEAIKRVNDEKMTYSRLTALTGDFLCIYTVDPATGRYFEYTVTPEYENFGLQKSGGNFFKQAHIDAQTHVYSIDVDRFCNSVTLENVLKEIREHGMFELDYRTILGDEPIYTTLRGALVHEKDGDQLVFGIINVDARVKRDRDMLRNLTTAKKKADMDALTGVKNKHAYIDFETRLNRRIEDGEDVNFAMIVCDINGLKAVNDQYGHVAGDELIKSACAFICDIFKHSPVFRVGGDEFAVIAQGRDHEAIEALLAETDRINAEHMKDGKVVVACGMSKYQKGDRNVAVVFKRADAMMYFNKRKMKGEL